MCTGSERKLSIYTFSQSVEIIIKKCSSADLPSLLWIWAASTNSSWTSVHPLCTDSNREIDPVMVLLIRKGRINQTHCGWSVRMRNQLELLILCGSLTIWTYLQRSNNLSRHTQPITEVNTTPHKYCAIKHPYTMKTSALRHRNRTTGSRGGEKTNIK